MKKVIGPHECVDFRRCTAPERDKQEKKYLNASKWFTDVSLVPFLWDMSKQWRPRSEAAEHSVWSRFPLLASLYV